LQEVAADWVAPDSADPDSADLAAYLGAASKAAPASSRLGSWLRRLWGCWRRWVFMVVFVLFVCALTRLFVLMHKWRKRESAHLLGR